MPRTISNSVLSGFCLDVSLSSICLTAPLPLSAALYTFVLVFRVNVQKDVSSAFTIVNSGVDNKAYYVKISSTLLIFVASWMSSLAPFLAGFAIALATYPIARRLLRDTKQERYRNLPPPYQLTLALKIVSGSVWCGLWGLFLYNESWDERVDRNATMLTSLAAVALTSILLSILVFAADTWLHIATTTLVVTMVVPLPPGEANYSLALQNICTLTNNSFTALNATSASCTISPSFYPPILVNGYTALEVLNNQSANLSVLTTLSNSGSPLHYLSVAPSVIHQDHDFTAETFGMLASCTPVSRACHLEIGDNSTFSCNNRTFYEDGDILTADSLYRTTFRYPGYEDDGDTTTSQGVDNPLYYAAAFATQAMGRLDPEIFTDPEVIIRDKIVLGVVLSCNVTVLDVTYDLVEGQVKRFETKPSNVSTTNALTSAVTSTSFGFTNMISTMNMAATVAKSAQELADQFASLLGKTMLSGAAGSLRHAPATTAQLRQQVLVSRVPKAPLFLLVAANLCFPALGAILTTLAVKTSPEDRQAQTRLGIHGLTTHLFDKRYARLPVSTVEELYEEFHDPNNTVRVGICSSSSGGSKFQSFREMRPLRSESGTAAQDPGMIQLNAVENES